MRLRVLGAARFSLSFLLLAAASVHAEAPPLPPPAPPEAPPPASGFTPPYKIIVAQWGERVVPPRPIPHVTHHPAASSPPLPRPRPAELAPAPVAPNKAPAPVPLND